MNNAASLIKQRMEQRNGEVFDPITISVIAGVLSILFNLLRIYFLVRKNRSQSAGEVIHENCYYQTGRMRRIIRRAVRRRLSRLDYSKYGNALCNAILDYGASADIGELQSLYDGKSDDGVWQEL